MRPRDRQRVITALLLGLLLVVVVAALVQR